MKKKNLVETVLEQIKVDVHCGDVTAIEELLQFVPIENLISYLPEEDHKHFKHLKTDNDDNLRTKMD